jgi:excisionase family DNA binding protein
MTTGSKNRKPGTHRTEDWLTQSEAARIRGVSRQAIGDLVKRGRLQVCRIGGELLLNRKEVEAFVRQLGRPRRLAYLTENKFAFGASPSLKLGKKYFKIT